MHGANGGGDRERNVLANLEIFLKENKSKIY